VLRTTQAKRRIGFSKLLSGHHLLGMRAVRGRPQPHCMNVGSGSFTTRADCLVMSGFRPNLTGQAGLLRFVDRGRPEVSAIWSKRCDQPLTEVTFTGEGSQPGSCGRFNPQPSAAQSAGLKSQTPRAKQMAAPRRDHQRSPKSPVVRCRRRSSLPEAAIRTLDD
jgi:hypothetical protein